MILSNDPIQSKDEEIESILYITNYLFDALKEKKLKKLSDILEEELIRKIILEIEPNIESMTEKLEIVLNDECFGVRFGNYMKILNVIDKYIEFKKKTDFLECKKKLLNIKEKIIINDLLLKEDPKYLKRFINLFIVMTSISSKTDTFIDKISETEEKYMDSYIKILEKHITINNMEEPNQTTVSNSNSASKNLTTRVSFQRSSTLNPNQINLDNLNAKIEIGILKNEIANLEKDKNNLQATIENLKAENDQLVTKNFQLNEKIEVLTLKQNDLTKELQIANSNQINREDVLNDMMLINQLKSTIAQKEIEIVETQKENQDIVKKFLDKIAKHKKKEEEILLSLEEKNNECLELKSEYEKLKAKNKEFQLLKEKIQNYETLQTQNNLLTNQVSDLKIEKTSLESHINKLFNEISHEKETARKSEYLKEISENKIKELESEIKTIKEVKVNKQKINNFLSKRNSHLINFNPNENFNTEQDFNLLELESEYLLEEIENKVEERTNHLKSDIDELKTKKNFLKEENFRLEDENEKMKINLDEAEIKISQLKTENEKLLFEKEKSEVSIKKIELDLKMELFNLEKEKEIFEIKNSQNLIKLEEVMKIKDHLNDELDNSREQYTILSKEKNELIRELAEVKNEFSSTKTKLEKEKINLNFKKEKESLINSKSNESSKLNEVILNLRSETEKKNKEIKDLTDKILLLEAENKNLLSKIQENLKLYNINIKQRKEDFEFLKKAYDDQKNKIIKEHETVTNSMYEVIQEFIGIKTELNKKAALSRLSENGNNTIKNFSVNK